MTTVSFEVSENALAATRLKPDEFSHEMRLTAASAWYEQGKISQEVAARIAGMDRTDFLLALARMGSPSFQVDLSELDQEISHG